MGEILHAFGIDWRLIIIQIFNFTLLAGLLWYFLYTPILNMLSLRQEKIAKGIQDAENAEKSLSQADSEKKEILSQAQHEAENISVRAKEHADHKTSELLLAADSKALKILEDAKRKGEEIQSEARKASEAEVAKTAILAAERILRNQS